MKNEWEKENIIFFAIYIFYLGLCCILSFSLKIYFLFLITVSKANNILALSKVKLLLKILGYIKKLSNKNLFNN